MSLLFSIFHPVFAQTPQDLFKQANEAYAQGQYEQAASLYDSARSRGLHHWTLYYDLGNAYYKAGRVGKAVANYERAFRLHSRDRDVIYNLNLVLTRVGDPLLPSTALARLFWRLYYLPSINALAGLVSALWVGVCIVGGGLFLGHWRVSAERGFAALAILLVAGLWLGVRMTSFEQRTAIVVVSVAEVRSGPNATYAANFTVPEGRRVIVLEEQEPIQGWLEIGVPKEGLKGWVQESCVEVI